MFPVFVQELNFIELQFHFEGAFGVMWAIFGHLGLFSGRLGGHFSTPDFHVQKAKVGGRMQVFQASLVFFLRRCWRLSTHVR